VTAPVTLPRGRVRARLGRGDVAVTDVTDLMTGAGDRIRTWRRDIALFVRENFNAEPDRWQLRALIAFASDSPTLRIALKACAGPGKSAVMAWCAWWFLVTQAEPEHHPNAYALSITGENLRDNLWKELAVWRSRSPFLMAAFEWQAESIFCKEHKATWWIRPRTWPKTADPEQQGRTLSGLHAKRIAYFLDESGAIHPAVGRSAEQGLNDCAWGRVMQGGNPISLEGMLYQSCNQQRHLWTIFEVTGDPDDPERSPRINIEHAREQIALYGRDNPWVMAYILGKFPPSSINTLMGPDDVEAAKHRYRGLEKSAFDWSQKRIGIDVARFGDDRTVLWPRQGLAAHLPITLRGMRTTDIAARAMLGIKRWSEIDRNPEVLTFVDDSGHWGHGVVDNLISAGYNVQAVLFEDKHTQDTRFGNRRAEMWVRMSEFVKTRGCIHYDAPAELTAELTTPTYTFINGKFMLEPKEITKKLLQRSPDLADALALTFATPDMPAQMERARLQKGELGSGRGYVVSDYDPLDDRRTTGVLS
jgi:phage terminase large subunit